MSPDADDPVPYRGRQGWTSSARLHASTQLRARLTSVVSVLDVAETGAEYFRELLAARTVTVTTYSDGQYQDLVNVGYLPRGEVRHPRNCRYPDAMYPELTRELNAHGGYFTADLQDSRYSEFLASMQGTDAKSVMGVAIVTAGILRGEVFLTRGPLQSAFDRDDLELARDLATSFGSLLLMSIRRAEAAGEPPRNVPPFG